MQIGSKPGESTFQYKRGGDTFLVLDTEALRVYLYVVVDRLLCPSMTVMSEYEDRPYFWHDGTGMMYILKEHARARIGSVTDVDKANAVLDRLQEGLTTL